MKAINKLTDKQLETIAVLRFKREHQLFTATIKSLTLLDRFKQNGVLTDASFMVKTDRFADQRFPISLEHFFLDEIVVLHDFGVIDDLVKEMYS